MGVPKQSHLMPAQRVLVVSKAGSWEGCAGIRSSCVGWIGAYSGVKGGWLARVGMRGFVFGMSGSSWGHDKCLVGELEAYLNPRELFHGFTKRELRMAFEYGI